MNNYRKYEWNILVARNDAIGVGKNVNTSFQPYTSVHEYSVVYGWI